MRMPVLSGILAFAAPLSFSQGPADSTKQLSDRLALVKTQVAAMFQNQPDYTCLATFDRYRRLANEPAESKLDTIRVEVAFIGNRELYSWPGEGKFSEAPLTVMVEQGLIGDGTFAAQARNIFVGDLGVETFMCDEEPGESKLWRWAYEIPASQNAWMVEATEVIVDSPAYFRQPLYS